MSQNLKVANDQEKVKMALSDVEFLRSFIEGRQERTPDRTELAMTALIAGASLLLLLSERFVFTSLSTDLLSMAQNPDLRNTILIQSSLILGVLGLGVYGLAWLRARETESSMGRILGRQFKFLKLESFLPDLFLKSYIVSLVFLANQPQLLGVLLMAFTADYVLQGRFFYMKMPIKVLIGSSIYIAAIAMLMNASTSLTLPLLVFSSVSMCSLISIALARRNNHG